MDECEDITVGMKDEFQVELRELLEACDAVTPKEINMGYV